MRSKILALVGAVAMAVTLLGVPAAHAGGGAGTGTGTGTGTTTKVRYVPVTGGVFNDPWGDRDSQFRIERHIVEAIQHARKGSYIRIAVYSFDRVNVAQALINAYNRGVHVEVLHNDHQVTHAMMMMKHAFGTNRKKKSFDYTCKTGCRSEQGVLHDKIYLFEHTGAAHDVVMTGSANLTANATLHQFNDLLTKVEVPNLYNALLDLFGELKKDKTAKPLFLHEVLRDYELFVMPHPKTTAKNDPIMNILRPVQCLGANGGTGTNGRTTIRVSMHAWNGDRGLYIARRLHKLYAEGCNVEAMYSLGGSGVRHALAVPTARGTMPRHADGYDTDCDELHQVDMYSHQKYMTISGHYGDNRAASYVVTGSSNWTHSGMVGDEIILKAKGSHLVTQWDRNFDFIWDNRSHPDGSPGGFHPVITCVPDPTPPENDRPTARRTTGQDGLTFAGPAWESD